MAFCTNCGHQLADGAKFCFECGAKVNIQELSQDESRKVAYDGEIHKCPNCGDILDAYESVCKACGYEQRGSKATSSVQELAIKLQEIEENRVTSKKHSAFGFGQNTEIDQQKINLIRSFVIPNTKEDILEFAVLAASNVDTNAYDDSYSSVFSPRNAHRREVSEAWLAKLKQAYQKAKLVFAGDPRITEIQSLYDSTHKAIKRAKGRVWKILGIAFGSIIAVFVLIIVIALTSVANDEKNEIARLESIEIQVQEALEADDYALALMHADRLYYGETDEKHIRDWKIKRNYWIDKIIDEAAKKGIVLEKPEDKLSKTDPSSDTQSTTIEEMSDTQSSAVDHNSAETNNFVPSGNEAFNETQVTDSFTGDTAALTVKSNDYLSIKDFGYYYTDNYLHTLVVIANTMEDCAISFPTYRVTAYGENGEVLGTEENFLDLIYPRQEQICTSLLLDIPKKPAKLDVTVLTPGEYSVEPVSQMEHPTHTQMTGTNILVREDTITGEIFNANDYPVDSATVTVVFKNDNGKLVWGDYTYIEDIPAYGKVPFELSINIDGEIPPNVEVFAYSW